MSSKLVPIAMSLLLGCAAFRRGEYWDADTDAEPDETSDPPQGSSGAPPAETGDTDPTGTAGSSDETSGEASTGAPTGPSFAADILPLLRAGCERCHSADGAASNTTFVLGFDEADAYETTVQFVDVDNAASSRLLAKTAGQGHTGGIIYDDRSVEYDAILNWIEQGALP
jgi:hypothetical protein